MEIASRTQEGHYFVSLRGELDASSSILLDDALHNCLQTQPLSIRIDCADLGYISSAGLGVFVSYLQELEGKAIPLVLYAMRPAVENVFQVLGLDALVTILPDGDSARQYCEDRLPLPAAKPVTS